MAVPVRAVVGRASHVRSPVDRPGRLLRSELLLHSLLLIGRAREGSRIGGFEVDNVAKENFSLVQLIAPDDDRLEGKRAFAEAADHSLASGLDPFCDGDLAF